MYRDGSVVDVMFFVEHRDRELEVIAAVTRVLRERYRLSVAVASTLYSPVVSAAFIRPRVVVSTGIAPSKSESHGPEFIHAIFNSVYGRSITYACMNWEQVLSPINKSFRPPRDHLTKTRVHHVSWGADYRNFLVSCGVKPTHIELTGKPSLALLRRKVDGDVASIRSYLADTTGLPLDKRWLFFPMTCHMGFFGEYHVRSRIGVGSEESTVLEHAAYVRRTINQIFRWLASLDDAPDARDFVIVLRPHPAIAIHQYEDRFRELVGQVPDCVRICKAGNAHEWLAASEACFTNFSSLALDGNAVGKPAFLLEPEPYPWFLRVDWFEGLPRVETFEGLLAAVTHRTTDPVSPVAALAGHAESGLDGVQRTAAHLARLAKRGQPGRRSLMGLLKIFNGVHRRRAIGSLIRGAAARANLWQLVRPGIRPDYFTANDVVHFWSEDRLPRSEML